MSDLTEEVEKQIIDVQTFLGTLISHNAIAYQQDRISREWSFQYYLSNARERLLNIARQGSLTVLEVNEVDREARSAKEDWEIAESALKKAVERFAEMMRIT